MALVGSSPRHDTGTMQLEIIREPLKRTRRERPSASSLLGLGSHVVHGGPGGIGAVCVYTPALFSLLHPFVPLHYTCCGGLQESIYPFALCRVALAKLEWHSHNNQAVLEKSKSKKGRSHPETLRNGAVWP